MNRMNIRLSFLFLMLPAVFSLVGCSSEQTRTTPSPETVRNIPVLAVQQANVPDLLEAVGTVRAAQTSDASSQMMGNIVEIRAHEGDHVQRGQVLAVIDDSQPRAAVDRSTAADLAAQQQLVGADSDLALAESTLKRYQNSLRKEIGESAGVRRGESPSTSGSRASRYGKGRPGPGAGSIEPGTHVSGLHADSGAIRRRGDGEESRFRHAGFTRHADFHR